MKKIVTLFFLLLIVAAKITQADVHPNNGAWPTYNLILKNDVQVSPKIYEFEVWLTATSAAPALELDYFQLGIVVNSAIYNGGTISCSIINTGSGLPTDMQPTSVTYTQASNVIKLAGKNVSTTFPMTNGQTVYLTKLRLTNTADFAQAKANLTWNFTNSPYPTKIYAVGVTGGNITLPITNATVLGWHINQLNYPGIIQIPAVYNVEGTANYCSTSTGANITLSNSEVGVSYQLFKNNVMEGVAKIGNGSILTWNDNLAGTYTVVATSMNTNLSSTMNGSAVLTETIGLPGNAGVVSGNATICQGNPGETYSIPVVTNAESYVWEYTGTGVTILGNTNSAVINFSANATSGNLSVKAQNNCGFGTVSNPLSIVLSNLPDAAGMIIGTSTVSPGQTAISYSVPMINGATSYTWNYSGVGTTINGTSNSITIDFGANATPGFLTVKGTNPCGSGLISEDFAVNVNYTISASSNPTSGGSTIGSGTYSFGQSCTVTASANSGYTFLNWTENGATVSTNASYTFTVSGNRTLVANFSLGGQTVDLNNGLVGYYPFNGNANDMSGNSNNGTVNGATLTTDRFCNANSAYNFADVSNPQTIMVPNSTSLQFSNAATFSFWISMNSYQGMDGWGSTTANGYHVIFAKDFDQCCITGGIGGMANGEFTANCGTGSGGIGVGDTVPNSSINQWVNITYVITTTNVSIYANGNLVASQSGTMSFANSNTKDLWFGRLAYLWYPFNGKIDDIRIYSRAINTAEIQAIYNLSSGIPTNGLIAYYPFNGNANDVSGNGNNGTINGNVTLTQDRFGIPNSAYEFPGVAFNYISVPHSSSLSLSEFTISAWIYSETDYGSGQIVQKGRDINSGHYGLYTTAIGTTVSYGVSVGASVSSQPTIGIWHLVTGSISGNIAKFYVDGQLVADTIESNSFAYSGSESLAIGMHYYSGVPDFWTYPYKGKIDDILIYNRVLNDAEVLQIYQGSSGGSGLPSAASNISGSASVCQGQSSVTYTVPVISNATSYVWTLPSGAIGSSDSNSIMVNFSSNALSGNISVKGVNSCLVGISSSLTITVNQTTTQPSQITGPSNPCQNSIVNFSVNNQPAIYDDWYLPSKDELDSIRSNLYLYGLGGFGNGNNYYWSSTELDPNYARFMSFYWNIWQEEVKHNGSNMTAFPIRSFNTSHIYQLRDTGPAGGLIFYINNNGNGTYTCYELASTSFNAPWGCVGSLIGASGSAIGTGLSNTLAIVNNCTTPGTAAQLCLDYSVNGNIPFYWTVPSDWTIIGGQGTSQITVLVGSSNGNIDVDVEQECGVVSGSSLAVSSNLLPTSAGTITGLATVCQGQNSVTYTVPTITNATSYVWSLPTGATGTSTTNTISVNYSNIVISGDITVKGINSCGDGGISTKAINVNVSPAVGVQSLTQGSTIGCAPAGYWFKLTNYQSNTPGTIYTWKFGDGTPNIIWTTPISIDSIFHIFNTSSCGMPGNQFVVSVTAKNSCDSTMASIDNIKILKKPIADFSMSINNTCVNQSVNFLNTSTSAINISGSSCNNITSYNWNFGDGVTSTNFSPSHFYNTSGMFSIRLIAAGSCGPDTIVKTICINPIPTASFTMNKSIFCQPDTLKLTNTTTDTSMYCNTPTYTWNISCTNTNCNSSNCNNGYIYINGTNQNSKNPIIKFTQAGIYDITLTVDNGCGSNTSSIQTITVKDKPTAAYTVVSPICANTSVCPSTPTVTNCYGTTALTYSWTTTMGSFPASNSASPGCVIAASSGNQTVSLVVSNECGTTTVPKTIVVNPLPDPVITGNNNVCNSQFAIYSTPSVTGNTYNWSVTGGSITSGSGSNSVTINWNTAGNQTITLIQNSNSNCSKTVTYIVTVNPKPVINNITTPICSGQLFTVTPVNVTNGTVPAGTTYTWSAPSVTGGLTGGTSGNNAGSISGTLNNPTNTAQTATYTITPTSGICSGNTFSVIVTVNPKPNISQINKPICSGESFTVTPVNGTNGIVPSGTTYTWSVPAVTGGITGGASGSGTSMSGALSNPTNTAQTATYTIIPTSGSCPGASFTVAVTVKPTPNVSTTSQTTICSGNQTNIVLGSNVAGTTFSWTVGTITGGITGASNSNGTSILQTLNNPGSLSGTVTYIVTPSANSCSGSPSTIIVTVNPLPATAGTITGLATVCQGQNSVVYKVPTITNATSYTWNLPTGASGTSSADTIVVSYGTSAVSGSITVKGNNTCGSGAVSTKAVTVNPLPATAGTISGLSTVCQGQNSVTYKVSTIANATSYTWTLPNGATGTSNVDSIVVSYGTSAISGNITVKGNNACGSGAVSTKAIIVNPLPATAGTIEGLATVCQGQNSVTYTVPTIANATSYVWTLPTGATGTSTTASITVNFGTSAVSGNITVKGTNSCGEGGISTKAITINPLPLSAGTIEGLATVCQGQNSVTYTLPTINNATSYVWTLPTGATGTSTTASITVNFGTSAVSGNITVKGTNSCGEGGFSTKVITVNPLPATAGTIEGLATVCQGQNSVTYTVPTIANAISYTWTLPTGASGTSSADSIVVSYGTSAVSGNITVKGNNSCGSGTVSTKAITVNPLPVTAGTINGLASACQGQNSVVYKVPTITNATSYTWTLPNGATGTSNVDSIVVSYGTSAVSGNLTVKGNNACGSGAVSTKAIIVNPLPATAGTITGLATVCQGQSNVVYKVPTVANSISYTWTLPTGASGTSSADSIVVSYGTSAISGNITVKGNNACGSGAVSTKAIIVNPLPATAGTITGLATVCQGQSNVVYKVPTVANSISYTWTLPTGASGTSSADSIVVSYGTSAISGNISVKGNNACGSGTVSTKAIIVNPLPATAGTIEGLATVCQGQNSVTYKVSTIANAISYTWSIPTGASGTSSADSIVVSYGTSSVSGNITVKGNNACGSGVVSTKAITVNPLLATAGTITGLASVCQGQSNVVYKVPIITNATSYTWTLPTGASGTSSVDSIIVSYGTSAVSGNITVKGNNSCGSGTVSTKAITVNPLPVTAGTINGLASACQGQNSVVYKVPTITNATSYTWTLPNGATGTSSVDSIVVSYGTSAVSGNITVKGNNACGSGTVSTKAITVNPLPVTAGTINGLASACQGQNSVVYKVPTITNATSYTWTLPNGATGTSSVDSIVVSYGTSAVSGNITVKGNNACGSGAVSTKAITVNPLPATAGTITGLTTVCQGQNSVTYKVSTIANAISYTWTLPTGASGTSSADSIVVSYGTSAISGNITVKGNNACGSGVVSTKAITVNPLPLTAGTITGLATVCQGQNSVVYKVPTITNATSYTWTLPNGATGTSSVDSIVVSYGTSAVSGNITVKGNNACGSGAVSTKAIIVNPLPATAGTISGLATVCQGQNSVTYKVSTIANAISYTWTLPTGASGTNSADSIVVSYGTSAVSGNITVKGNNTCGSGVVSTKAIIVNPLPATAGTITGLATVCQGQNSVVYKVPTITNATSYTWTFPTGASGTSTIDSIIVNYGTSTISGNVTVKGNNTCGSGVVSIKAITVNPLPATAGTIEGLATVCQGQNSVTYKVSTIANAISYTWTLPTGASGTSSADSIVVSYGISSVSGNITVKGNNTCGSGVVSTKAIIVNPLPATAGTITGLVTVCQGQNSVVYKVPTITNATSYTWTLPTGASGTSSIDSIIVSYGTSAVSGNIKVNGNNTCGSGAVSTKAITVNPLPVVSNQTTSITSGSVFTVTPSGVPAGTTYTWTSPVYTGGVLGGSAQTVGQPNISQTLTILSGSGTATYTVTPTSGNCSGNPFTVTVSVNQIASCPPPWIPVQNQQYNMNVIAKLYLSNVLTTNNADAIGAFVGNECRGIAYPDSSVNGIVFLTISSNVQSGETVTFKAWRSQLCDECPVSESIPFVNQTEIGTMAIPYEFHCGLVELCNNFGAGYNWFSVNINPGSMSLNSLFNNLTPCENDRIIGQQSFATYYGNQWVGSLTTIDPKAMYKLKLCSQQTWCKLGLPVNIQPITVASGYPWIGYLPQTNLAINTALSGISPTPISNDRFNAQSSFATYSSNQWIGSLTTLQKGKGYIIHLANPSVLTYPTTSNKSAILIEDNLTTKALSASNNVKTNARYNMQIVADILLPNGNISNNTADTVYAYVGNECRGISSPLAGLNGKLFLTIGSDIEQGEVIHFKVFVSSLNQLFDVNSNLVFASEMETGTMGNPYHFDLTGSVGISLYNNQNEISFGDIYPNPFDKTASLDFNIYNTGKVEGKIINGLGIEVQTIVSKDFESGSYILKINGENLTPGIYSLLIFYSNKENSSVITRKMIIK